MTALRPKPPKGQLFQLVKKVGYVWYVQDYYTHTTNLFFPFGQFLANQNSTKANVCVQRFAKRLL